MIRAAGDLVEVVDAASRLHRSVGSVAFFVGDNVFVSFGDTAWSPVRMFYPEQLRAVAERRRVPRTRRAPLVVRRLRASLARMWL